MSVWNRKRSLIKSRLAVTLVSVMALVISCTGASTPTGGPSASAEVNPGKLTIAVANLADEKFDPTTLLTSSGSLAYMLLLHGFLIATNEKGELAPGIASAWNVSPDGLTWTFTIRDGVKWHDGSPVTPEDVAWTFGHYYGPHAAMFDNSQFVLVSKVLDRIEVDGNRVRVITKAPIVDLDFRFSEITGNPMPIMPKRPKLQDVEEELAYEKHPIGAGPMRLTEHVTGQAMRFERFNDYYYQPANGLPQDRRVSFSKLDLLVVSETSTRVASLRTGEADIVAASLPVKGQVVAAGGRAVVTADGMGVYVRTAGCLTPRYPCSNKNVRQALGYAINREQIRDRLYGGSEAFDANGWWVMGPQSRGYTPDVKPYPFDPARARKLLADGGYPEGKGFGTLIMNVAPSGNVPFLPEAAQLIAAMWTQELGINVEVRVGDFGALTVQQKSGKLDGQVWLVSTAVQLNPAGLVGANFGPTSAMRINSDADLARLVQETYGILDPAKRDKAVTELYLRILDSGHVLGVGQASSYWGVGPRVLAWNPYQGAELTGIYTAKLGK